MINPKELSIGNYFIDCDSDNARKLKSILIKDNGYNVIIGEDLSHISNLIPVELTKEWLIKFGFKNTQGDQWIKGDIRIAFYRDNTVTLIFIPNSWRDIDRHELKRREVHKLQNLIFELTDKELEIK